MLTQKTKSIIKKFTVLLMLLSFAQSSWATIGLKFSDYVGKNDKLAYDYDSSMPANYYDTNDYESHILNIDNYVENDVSTPVDLNQSVKITDSKTKINLSLRDSDVKQVLRMFAQKAGLNVVFHSSVDGKITLDLNNVTLNDAFLLVLKTAELSYVVDGKNVIVASAKKANTLSISKQNLTIIPVKYEMAQNIANFLNQNIFSAKITGLSGENIVSANPATNEILVFGTQSDADVARKIVEKLDRKPMVNTFKVNHTTPKEMAKLICSTFVDTASDVEDDEEEDDEDDESGSGEGGSGDSGSSGDSGDDELKKVKLGKGKVACRATQATLAGQSSGSGGSDSNGGISSKGGGGGAMMSSGMDGGMGADGSLYSASVFNSAPLTVIYFSDLGTININGGSIEQVRAIKEFIQQNDKKQPMAYIEMSVIELNESGSKEFSNEWMLWTPFMSLNFNSETGLSTNTYNPTFFMGDTYTQITKNGDTIKTETINKYKGDSTLVYKLSYLVKNGKGRVLTNPKIMVTNGQKTTIDMTSDYIKTVKTEMITTVDNAGMSRTYEVGDDEGIKIEMMPFISLDGYVSLNLKPNFSTIKERVYAKGQSGEDELAATLLQRRDLSLKNIRIKDGETLVLAGLIRENETTQTTKIPVLGDLPLVGSFFRSSNSQKSKEELVILITPHIVYSSNDIANIKPTDL